MVRFINNNDKEDHAIYYSKEEELNEQAVYRGNVKRSGYCIFSDVQDNRNFDKEIYIKVYNNINKHKATKLVRVSMKTGAPLQTEHRNTGRDAGKTRLKFTKEVAEFLTKAMTEKPNAYKYPEKIETVYDAIYYNVEEKFGNNYEKFPIPNFMENIEK